ncbi:TetR/AcrR family transcriptional regulator [Nocardiopsis sp. NPDC050513]|uniref:TetR/AcrR family transcriptional regulator n=1 Tax=Nocardiopsis sp. NPDC050513 TaxID=3364338 RepID=UPI0037A37F20
MAAKTGRPRGFDRDTALEQAMFLFWEHGYDAVSVRDLTQAMGVAPASLYAAFTDKPTLFEEAVDVYARRYGTYIQEAIECEPTAYRAVRRLLTRYVAHQTDPGRPAGCLILNGATGNTASPESVSTGLRARRAHTADRVEGMIRADIERGDLPPGTDARALASFFLTVWQGLSRLALDGYGHRELEGVVSTAMTAWPATDG